MIALLVAPLAANAISGTREVAWPGRPVMSTTGWHSGTFELVNDPARTHGWNPWFSGYPNDVDHYEFKLSNTDDVNRLTKKLAAIQAPKLVVRLNPAVEPRALGFTTVLAESNRTAVLFSVGNQASIDQFHRSKGAFVAMPPTLTLYAGNEAIDLKKVEIPDGIQVIADFSPPDQRDTNAPAFKAIEEFLKNRQPAATPANTNAIPPLPLP